MDPFETGNLKKMICCGVVLALRRFLADFIWEILAAVVLEGIKFCQGRKSKRGKKWMRRWGGSLLLLLLNLEKDSQQNMKFHLIILLLLFFFLPIVKLLDEFLFPWITCLIIGLLTRSVSVHFLRALLLRMRLATSPCWPLWQTTRTRLKWE